MQYVSVLPPTCFKLWIFAFSKDFALMFLEREGAKPKILMFLHTPLELQPIDAPYSSNPYMYNTCTCSLVWTLHAILIDFEASSHCMYKLSVFMLLH